MPRLTDSLTAFIQKLSQRSNTRAQTRQAAQPAGSMATQVMSSLGVPNPKSLRQAYLNNLIANCRPVSFASLQFSGTGPASSLFLLDRLYVPPDTRTSLESKNSEGEAETNRVLSAVEAVARETGQRVVLLGAPGSGKSTFLCYLALQHARALNSAEMTIEKLLPDWAALPLLPVLINLNHLAQSLNPELPPDGEVIERYLRTDDNSRLYAIHLLEEVDRSGGLFLFDGLDEIDNPTYLPHITQALQAFVAHHNTHPATRFVITCRSLSYAEPGWQLPGWSTHELAPLSEEKIYQFVENWYDELIRTDLVRRTFHENNCAKLLASLRSGDPNRLLDLASNPLLLNTLTATHADKGGLPEPRVLIYQACIDHYITHWIIDSGRAAGKYQMRRLLDFLQVSQAELLRLLQEIAYQAHAIQPEQSPEMAMHTCSLISEERLSSILQTHLGSDEKVHNALVYFRQPNGMLTVHKVSLPQDPSPDQQPSFAYGFLHPTIEEYLAALHLARKVDLGLETRQHINQGGRWREVLLLLGEHICFCEADAQRLDGILNALAPAPLPQEGLSPDGWRAVWMAGELLNIYRRTFPQREQEHKHIPRGLVNLLQARGTSLPAHERASAGDVLDSLGDPRFRADDWYLPDEVLLGFLLIPAGPFLMGSDPFLDPAAKEPEQPQHELYLPDFYIARNLITVSQFKAFVEDSGYQPANAGSLLGRLSRPVVYVGWQDALLYCAWLTGKLRDMAARRVKDWAMSEAESHFWEGLLSGELVATLPSEAEWEKAARGPITASQTNGVDAQAGEADLRHGLIYPWGQEFDPNKANTAETGLGTTSPVGCFSMGASPYGVQDMAGNVWEWTRTLWGNDFINSSYFYPYIPSDGRENLEANESVLRVIRGGSFFYHSWHTRISSRGRSIPPEWDWDIGFRVAITALKSTNRRTGKW